MAAIHSQFDIMTRTGSKCLFLFQSHLFIHLFITIFSTINATEDRIKPTGRIIIATNII